MKDTFKPGVVSEFAFVVGESKTVPALYPEAPEFQAMPRVFATGFMVGFIEWACIRAVNPHLDQPEEQTIGKGTHERFVISKKRFDERMREKSSVTSASGQ